MKIIDVEQRTDEWHDLRRGKITGSKLKDIVPLRGNGRKIGFYELLADRLATTDGYESETPMDRGVLLEDEAIKEFEKETKKKVEKVGLCVKDDNENIALSPDGLIKKGKKYVEAVEVKCLSSARHLEAHFEQKIPSEYTAQSLQNFIVNEHLETLYFVFYDPRVTVKTLHYITIQRDDVQEDIDYYLEYQENILKEVNTLLEELAF